jgi:predicted O-methyltransferase YrrM
MLDADFLSSARELLVPSMGTEGVAPLLYWLVRLVRPESVLEVGMGYTTAFIAKALADNSRSVAEEREALLLGTEAVASLGPIRPSYYTTGYDPKLICVDRMTDERASAERAHPVLQSLGLSQYCEVIQADLRTCAVAVQTRTPLIDLAWVDTWDTLAFFEALWGLITPAGGLVLIHWLLTYPEGRAVLRYIESLRAVDGELEVLSLLEPFKSQQNSVTLVKRVSGLSLDQDWRLSAPAECQSTGGP